MQWQKQFSNHLLAPTIWTQSILERTSPRRRRRGTSERISPPTPPLLTHLVKNSHLLLSRLSPPTPRRNRTTNKVPGAAEDKDRVVTPTLLSQVSISFPRRRGTSPKSSAITAIGKDITLTSIHGIRKRSPKTSDNFDNLYARDCS